MLEPVRPRGFREPLEVSRVSITGRAPLFAIAKKKKPTGARAAGLRYEKRVQAELLERFPKHYVPSPWLHYFDKYGQRWCQPDGLLVDVDQGLLTVVEMKHHHTGEAWWKLHKMYLPLVRMVFGPAWKFSCLEIVRWYDPEEIFPNAKLCEFPHLCPPLPHTGVHILKPRGEVDVRR